MDKLDRMDQFCSMVAGTILGTNNIVNWLNCHGYFDAPASKGHHLAEPGGLYTHSMCVAKRLVELTDKLGLKWQRECSPIVVGLLHDLCKMDAYIPKYEYSLETTYISGEIVKPKEPYLAGYEWNDHQLIGGHGDKSVMLASQIITLTEEEVMCIRYHMGSFSDDAKQRSAYSDAVKKYPNVLWTHTADMWSSQIDNC